MAHYRHTLEAPAFKPGASGPIPVSWDGVERHRIFFANAAMECVGGTPAPRCAEAVGPVGLAWYRHTILLLCSYCAIWIAISVDAEVCALSKRLQDSFTKSNVKQIWIVLTSCL